MPTNTSKGIIVTPGDPAGIGPDVIVKLAQQALAARLLVIADPAVLEKRAQALQLPIKIKLIKQHQDVSLHEAQTLSVMPIECGDTVTPGISNPNNARYVLDCLKTASKICMQNQWSLVTGPVNKSMINQASISFSGHTEFLAEQAKVDQTVMLFVTEQLKIALLTTHLPLKDVSQAITKEKLKSTLRICQNDLKKWFQINSPKIAVCGLNPHAGENGHLGHEEIEVINPAIREIQQEGINAHGAFPADTALTPSRLANHDLTLAMYHDQGLPVVKYAGFGQAVNMTLGLPYIRTSVDHGTAYDIAGSGKANPNSLDAALTLAIRLAALQPLSND